MASMPTETGPTLTTADASAYSQPFFTSLNPLHSAAFPDLLYAHCWSCRGQCLHKHVAEGPTKIS